MAGFQDILGHEQIIEHLQNAIKTDKVSHAYILDGPDMSGKKMIADALHGMSFLQAGTWQKSAGHHLSTA